MALFSLLKKRGHIFFVGPILQKFSTCRSLDFTFLARCDDALNLDVYLRLLRMISFHLSNDIAQIFDNDVFRVSLTRSESGYPARMVTLITRFLVKTAKNEDKLLKDNYLFFFFLPRKVVNTLTYFNCWARIRLKVVPSF